MNTKQRMLKSIEIKLAQISDLNDELDKLKDAFCLYAPHKKGDKVEVYYNSEQFSHCGIINNIQFNDGIFRYRIKPTKKDFTTSGRHKAFCYVSKDSIYFLVNLSRKLTKRPNKNKTIHINHK